MMLRIKWKYPDESYLHERTFYDIDPETIEIRDNFVSFGEVDQIKVSEAPRTWKYPIDYITDLKLLQDN